MLDKNIVELLCDKIVCAAEYIAEIENNVASLQNQGDEESANYFLDLQYVELEKLQSLTLRLTNVIVPEGEEEQESAESLEE